MGMFVFLYLEKDENLSPLPLDMIKEYLSLSFTQSLEIILYPTSPLIHWSVFRWRRTAQGTDWAIGPVPLLLKKA